MNNDNLRWIAEPELYRRWRRIKDFWRAFVFLARGGKFKVVLDFSGIDPRILGGAETFIVRDNQVVDLARYRYNAIAESASKMNRLAGLTLAADDDPDGFRVKWAGTTRDEAWARNNPGQ